MEAHWSSESCSQSAAASMCKIPQSHFSQIERGVAPSPEQKEDRLTEKNLRRIIKGLRMLRHEEYLLLLMNNHPPRTAVEPPTHPVGSSLLAMLESLNPNPATLLNERMDILAWNEAAKTVLVNFDDLDGIDRNILRIMFSPDLLAQLHGRWKDWDEYVEELVASFKGQEKLFHESAHDIARFHELVTKLQALPPVLEQSLSFASLYARPLGQRNARRDKVFLHAVGELWSCLTWTHS